MISLILVKSELLFPNGRGNVYYPDVQEKGLNKSYDKIIDKVSKHLKKDKDEEAIKVLNNVIKKNPKHELLYHLYSRLALIYVKLKKNDEALKQYNKAITWIKKNKKGRIEDIYISIGYLKDPKVEDKRIEDNMISYLKTVLKKNPGLKNKYLIDARLGDCYYSKAYPYFRKDDDTNGKEYYFKKAKQYYEKVIKAKPKDICFNNAKRGLAHIYLGLEDKKNALKIIKSIKFAKGSSYLAHDYFRTAGIYLELAFFIRRSTKDIKLEGEFRKEAGEYYEKIIKTFPKSPYCNRSKFQLVTRIHYKDPDKKLKILDSVSLLNESGRAGDLSSLVNHYKNCAQRFNGIGNTKKFQYCNEKAIKHYKTFIKDYPEHSSLNKTKISIAEVYINSDKLKEASKIADTLNDPGRTYNKYTYARFYVKLAEAYHYNKKFSFAEKYYLRTITLLKQYIKENTRPNKDRIKKLLESTSKSLEQCKEKITISKPRRSGKRSGRTNKKIKADINTEEGCFKLLRKQLTIGKKHYEGKRYEKACNRFKKALDTIKIFKRKYRSSEYIQQLPDLKLEIEDYYKKAKEKM